MMSCSLLKRAGEEVGERQTSVAINTAIVKRTTRTETYDISDGSVKDGTLMLVLTNGELLWINHRDWVEIRWLERTKDD